MNNNQVLANEAVRSILNTFQPALEQQGVYTNRLYTGEPATIVEYESANATNSILNDERANATNSNLNEESANATNSNNTEDQGLFDITSDAEWGEFMGDAYPRAGRFKQFGYFLLRNKVFIIGGIIILIVLICLACNFIQDGEAKEELKSIFQEQLAFLISRARVWLIRHDKKHSDFKQLPLSMQWLLKELIIGRCPERNNEVSFPYLDQCLQNYSQN